MKFYKQTFPGGAAMFGARDAIKKRLEGRRLSSRVCPPCAASAAVDRISPKTVRQLGSPPPLRSDRHSMEANVMEDTRARSLFIYPQYLHTRLCTIIPGEAERRAHFQICIISTRSSWYVDCVGVFAAEVEGGLGAAARHDYRPHQTEGKTF